jgi:hypothetical protein
MQRPGQLIAVAASASDNSPTSLQGLGRTYAGIVRRGYKVSGDQADEVKRYLHALRLWKRYGGHQGALAKLDDVEELSAVELQDIWLANPQLPSATGAVTDDVIDELPQLAANIGLVRQHNFTRNDRGRAIAALYSDDLLKIAEGDVSVNLFQMITRGSAGLHDRPGGACYLLYSLIEADGDFLTAAWYTQLQEGDQTFTRASFGSLLPTACRRLADRISKSRSMEDRHLVSRLDATARHIDEKTPSNQKTWGGGRPRDQVATLRLEPYVDFGLVTKESRTDYRYSLDEVQRAFFQDLTAAPDLQVYLDTNLVAAYLTGIGRVPIRLKGDEIWERIKDAYQMLRSGLGYAPAKEVVLLAIAILLNEGGTSCFEVADGIASLREEQQRHPDQIRYGVSRTGEPTHVRMGRKPRA